MAVAQARQPVKELGICSRRTAVGCCAARFTRSPGEMPGHMNVLLAEADVPNDSSRWTTSIRSSPTVDLAVVIGANDVVNPSARGGSSPIYGMPIINVDHARTVYVLG